MRGSLEGCSHGLTRRSGCAKRARELTVDYRGKYEKSAFSMSVLAVVCGVNILGRTSCARLELLLPLRNVPTSRKYTDQAPNYLSERCPTPAIGAARLKNTDAEKKSDWERGAGARACKTESLSSELWRRAPCDRVRAPFRDFFDNANPDNTHRALAPRLRELDAIRPYATTQQGELHAACA